MRTTFKCTANLTTYYDMIIRAADCSANKNTSSTTQYFDVLILDQEGSAHYSSRWPTATCKFFSGGNVENTSKRGATATFTYVGKSLEYVTEESPTRGSAKICDPARPNATRSV